MNEWEHFGSEHIIALAVIGVVMTAVVLWSRRLPVLKSDLLIRVLAVTLFVCEITQDIILSYQGHPIDETLPLHLCNLGIFVNLPAAFGRRGSRLVIFFSEISVMLILPGALGALLFPGWNYKPILSWLPVMCFFTHMLEVLIPLLLVSGGRSRLRLTHFHYSYIFLGVITPFIYVLDKKTDANYMFLMTPSDDSPLSFVHDITGSSLYLPGVLLLLTAVLCVEYAAWCGLRKVLVAKRDEKRQQ